MPLRFPGSIFCSRGSFGILDDMKKYIAEMLGTFGLTFAVGLSLMGDTPVSTPVLAALVVVLFVYSLGAISGGHFNPAITLGAWSIQKIHTKDAIRYLISQFLGAGVALLCVSNLVGMPVLTVNADMMTVAAECLGALFFAFGVASIMYGKVPSDFTGVVAGGSLLLGITVAVLLGSNGVLNPAVAFGIGSFNLVYGIAPVVGAILGMQAYKYAAA